MNQKNSEIKVDSLDAEGLKRITFSYPDFPYRAVVNKSKAIGSNQWKTRINLLVDGCGRDVLFQNETIEDAQKIRDLMDAAILRAKIMDFV